MEFSCLYAKWIFWTSAQRVTPSGTDTDGQKDSDSMNGPVIMKAPSSQTSSFHSSSSLIFGYLNLFSDGVVSFIPLFSLFSHEGNAYDNFCAH